MKYIAQITVDDFKTAEEVAAELEKNRRRLAVVIASVYRDDPSDEIDRIVETFRSEGMTGGREALDRFARNYEIFIG